MQKLQVRTCARTGHVREPQSRRRLRGAGHKYSMLLSRSHVETKDQGIERLYGKNQGTVRLYLRSDAETVETERSAARNLSLVDARRAFEWVRQMNCIVDLDLRRHVGFHAASVLRIQV